MQRTAIGMLLVVLAVSGAGCGGSSKGTTPAEFAKAGNAVCATAMVRFKSGLSNGTVEAQFVTLQRTKISKLGALTPPDGLERVYTQYKAVLARRLDVIQRYLAAVRAKTSLHVLRSAILQARVEEGALAKALGFTACDENSI